MLITFCGLFGRKVLRLFEGLLIVFLGASLHGNVMVVAILFFQPEKDSSYVWTINQLGWFPHLKDLQWHILAAVSLSVGSYLFASILLHWIFYTKRRDQAKEWKCQPNYFPSAMEQRLEIILGSISMFLGGICSGLFSCYIFSEGQTRLYFDPLQRGVGYLIFSTVLMFLVLDAELYYLHRLCHHRFFYKTMHKWHHHFKAPTPFSATAVHPVEFLMFQTVLILPTFFIPTYAGAYLVLILYIYYYGVIHHSGIKMESIWPWEPASMFHDNHHKHFEVNYGFHTKLWDWMHGTLDIYRIRRHKD